MEIRNKTDFNLEVIYKSTRTDSDKIQAGKLLNIFAKIEALESECNTFAAARRTHTQRDAKRNNTFAS